jgi:hypothetical protein
MLFFTVVAVAAGFVLAQANPGIFTDEGSVGQTPPGCKAHYEPATGEYRITGGGANIRGSSGAFYFVWKKVSGDITLTADVQFPGASAAQHRKAVLMIRQSLDPDSAYADGVSHGNRRCNFAEPRANKLIRCSRRWTNRHASAS